MNPRPAPLLVLFALLPVFLAGYAVGRYVDPEAPTAPPGPLEQALAATLPPEVPRPVEMRPAESERVPVEEPAERRVEELEEQLAATWQRMANLERLAYDSAPRDALAIATGRTVQEVDDAVSRSHLVDDAAQLQVALRAVGAAEFWKMMDEERSWLRVHAEKSKALDEWAFRSWVDRASREFCEDLARRGLPFTLTEQFRRIVAE
jgi:hypothetical protein